MVVGADHRGRAGVGIWRDAATGPLTALASGPVTVGAPAGPGRRPGGVAGRSRPSGPTPSLTGPPGAGCAAGLGQWCSATASSSLLEGRVVRRRVATPRSVFDGGAAAFIVRAHDLPPADRAPTFQRHSIVQPPSSAQRGAGGTCVAGRVDHVGSIASTQTVNLTPLATETIICRFSAVYCMASGVVFARQVGYPVRLVASCLAG
jgi:hypothetical protein